MDNFANIRLTAIKVMPSTPSVRVIAKQTNPETRLYYVLPIQTDTLSAAAQDNELHIKDPPYLTTKLLHICLALLTSSHSGRQGCIFFYLLSMSHILYFYTTQPCSAKARQSAQPSD